MDGKPQPTENTREKLEKSQTISKLRDILQSNMTTLEFDREEENVTAAWYQAEEWVENGQLSCHSFKFHVKYVHVNGTGLHDKHLTFKWLSLFVVFHIC